MIEILCSPSIPERREGFIRTAVPAYEVTAGAKREPIQVDRRVRVEPDRRFIFEIVEWNVIGFAWLQAAYIGIGAAIVGLATWVRMADVLLHVPENVPPPAAR